MVGSNRARTSKKSECENKWLNSNKSDRLDTTLIYQRFVIDRYACRLVYDRCSIAREDSDNTSVSIRYPLDKVQPSPDIKGEGGHRRNSTETRCVHAISFILMRTDDPTFCQILLYFFIPSTNLLLARRSQVHQKLDLRFQSACDHSLHAVFEAPNSR